ncbi:MAG: hypothetical protein J7J92_00050 [Candidatus Aenigmarchaeota archaeon]|nr:hypothetical protein [Candidatus Aenigmarchaeota archaeon]
MIEHLKKLLDRKQDVFTLGLRQIFDSLGNPTVEAVVNYNYRASCPTGTSKSSFAVDSLEVQKAINNFYKIRQKFIGRMSQIEFDSLLRDNLDKLGSSITTAISLAFFSGSFGLKYTTETFPKLAGKVIGGGMHAKSKKTQIQEFLVIPSEPTIRECIKTNFKIWRDVGQMLRKIGHVGMDYEGGWTADITDEGALNIITEVIEKKNYNVKIGIDAAASSWYDEKKRRYIYNGEKMSKNDLVKFFKSLVKRYDIFYLEDPFDERHFDAFAKLKRSLRGRLVVGDDLIATNPDRMREAIKKKSISGVIIKPNQIGTVTDAFTVMEMADNANIVPVVSHRSAETCSATVSKMAMFGSIAKFGIAGIRIAKLNELVRLWDMSENPVMKEL